MSAAWQEYERVHANRRNLIIHLLAVPLFDAAFLLALFSLAQQNWIVAAVSVVAAFGAMAVQGFGHSKERIEPRPFSGPLDFLRRWFTEQYFRFPAFVITGRWWRQYKAADD